MTENTIDNLLKHHGLICHTFSYNDLPAPIKQKLAGENCADYANNYLSLLANAGPEFWHRLMSQSKNTKDKTDWVDKQSIALAKELLSISKLENGSTILYPANFAAPLVMLGELAGWSTPSPLGLGIHSTYGPWFAYRALIVTTKPLTAISSAAESSSACLTCPAPCVDACPADAVSKVESFNIKKCADHRTLEQSNCKSQCHARNACPIGRQYRYTEQQRAYHMTHALSALIAWAAKN